MFRIKICGVTTPADAIAAAAAGADAIGLNFCPTSKRRIDAARASEIVAASPTGVLKVGVFADAPASEIVEFAEHVALDALQLHGSETPASLGQLGSRRVIKAFGCGPDGHEAVLAWLDECRRAGSRPFLVLLDADRMGELGGTGRLSDWTAAATYRSQEGVPPLVLAGGLTPENVGEAIRRVRPAAVDTASGVERSPGLKDPDKIARFVSAARAAFNEIEHCG